MSFKWISHRHLSLLIVFVLSLGIRAWYITQKEGLYMDESASVIISLRNEWGWTKNFENKVYSGKEIKEMSFGDNDNLKETVEDLYQLHKDTYDVDHSNLYYSCLRLWIKLCGGQTGNLQSMIIQGCSLNLLFFVLSFFLLYALAKRLFTNQWMIILTLVIAFFNTGSISNTLLIREYQLQETFFILMTYLFIHFYRQIDAKKSITSWKNLCLISTITCFVFLTGYFSIIYITLYFAVLALKSFKVRMKQNLPFLFFSLSFAFILANAIYCSYCDGFFLSLHRKEILHSVKSNGLSHVVDSLLALISIMTYHLFYSSTLLISLIVGLYLIFRNRGKLHLISQKDTLFISCIGVTFLWAIVVIILVPYKISRYIAPVFPLLSLVIPWLISKLEQKKQVYLAAVYFLIYLIAMFNSHNIEYLYPKAYEKQVFNQYPEVPVVVAYNPFVLYCVGLLPLISDNQQYEFTQSTKEMLEKLGLYDEVFFLVEKDMDDLAIPDNCDVKRKFDCGIVGNFTGYHLIKRK